MPSSKVKDIMKQTHFAIATGRRLFGATPFDSLQRQTNANQNRLNVLESGLALRDRAQKEADSARTYVQDRMDALHANVAQTIGAILLASREYDKILNTQASKSLIGEIFVNLVITLIPWAKPLQQLAGHNASFQKWTLGARASVYLKAIDEKMDDLIGSVRNPIVSSNQALRDEEQAERNATIVSMAIKGELADLYEYEQKFLNLVARMRDFIDNRRVDIIEGRQSDPYIRAKIESVFKICGLDKIKKVGKLEFERVSDLMLYCMLRKYVEQHVTFTIPRTYNINSNYNLRELADLPQLWPEDCIEGLNDRQRKAIYQKFGLTWFSSNWTMVKQLLNATELAQYPAIIDYRDILKYWKNGEVFQVSLGYAGNSGVPSQTTKAIVLK